jgi:AraC-like DNA-binding protein
MLIQFSDGVVRDMMRVCPELEEINPLLEDARHGIEFLGEDARRGANLLREVGRAAPTRRMLLFLELLDLLNRCDKRKILSSTDYAPTLDHDVSEVINKAINYLIHHLTEDIHLSDVATSCGMSDSAFSRFFKKNTGHGFVRYMNRMRVNRACTLLTETTTPVTDICFESGFNNLSNFNRQFLSFCGVTPSEYRRHSQRNATCSTELFNAAAQPAALNPGAPPSQRRN